MTPEQLQTLKTAILADPNLTSLAAAFETGAITAYLSANTSFYVWKTTTPTADIYDAITWSALTPTDVPDGTQLWLNRDAMCQSKQLNLQILLQGVSQISSGKTNIRNGLSDALLNVPSGVSGALVSAGWLNVKAVMYRVANKLEAIFATGTGTVGVPGNLGYEGTPNNDLIAAALRA